MKYTGLIAPGVGNFLAAVRVGLLAQGWTSLGTVAANHEVFRSLGVSGTENIIIAINDSVAGSVGFRACTAYDDGTKILSNPTTYRYVQLSTTLTMPWWTYVKQNYFIAIAKNFAANPYALSYCGLINRYDVTDAYCIVCTGATTTGGVPIGVAHSNTFAGGGFQLLQDHAGVYNKTINGIALNPGFGASQLPNPVDGKIIISPILAGLASSEIHGELYDCYSVAQASVASEDVLTFGADTYLCFTISTYLCAIKET